MLRKAGTLFLTLAIALVSFGAVSAQGDSYTLGVSISTLNNPFFVTLRDGAQAAADDLGAELVVLDSQNDSATEAANVEDLIAQGVDAILINPTDSAAAVPSVLAANDAGIPVFTIDRSADEGEVVSHIASDNVAGGRLAAEFLCDAIGGSGNVVELQGIPGTSAARDRGQGFNDYMSSECADAEIVAQQPANFDRAEGLTVYENILQSQDSIDGVFAHNDSMILGALEAAEAAGRADDTVFVGFDAIDDAVAAVREGRLDATIAQQPALIGELGVETAINHLNGEDVSQNIPVDLRLISAVDGGITLGISISTLNNPFFVTLRDGAQAAADDLGAELVVLDSQNDSATEAANIEDLIAQDVDAILINPTDSAAVVPSVLAANDAGIPVFTIDRSADDGEVVSHIASDNVAGGRLAAEFLCDAIGGSGNVVELQGIPGTSAARDRGQGFNDYMSSECADAEIVAQQPANFDRAEGLTVYENILQSQDSIDGVFAHNDSMILGAIEAAQAADRAEGTTFVGFDAIDDAVAAVQEGTLAATVAQQPALIGELGVETAVDNLIGVDVSDSIPVELRLVTEENVSEFASE
jgi:ribose transport system substrate-binding protein